MTTRREFIRNTAVTVASAAAGLAEAMGARHMRLEELRAEALVGLVERRRVA